MQSERHAYSSEPNYIKKLEKTPLSNHDLGDSYEMPTNLIRRSILFSFILAIGGSGPRQGSIVHRREANTKKNFMKCIFIGILTGLAAS